MAEVSECVDLSPDMRSMEGRETGRPKKEGLVTKKALIVRPSNTTSDVLMMKGPTRRSPCSREGMANTIEMSGKGSGIRREKAYLAILSLSFTYLERYRLRDTQRRG